VELDPSRNFTVVVSRPEDRPANAVRRCGVSWLDWGAGDGAGNPDYGALIVRNMLVAPDFAEAIQNVPQPGAEREVMGPYFPESEYSTKADFEARGCAAPARRPKLRLRVRPRYPVAGRRVTIRFRVTRRGRPASGATVALAGRRARTNGRGRAHLELRLTPGAYRATARRAGARPGKQWIRAAAARQ
jgi:hypothetical protein